MAAKIVDGLFLGDALCSLDINFLVANKITRIVNCAGGELENRWEALGIEYITFDWPCSPNCDSFNLLDCTWVSSLSSDTPQEGQVLESSSHCPCNWLHPVESFIEQALENGDGVLVHSQDGGNRACTCIVAYLMAAFGWDVEKSISYMQSKRPDLLPCDSFYQQLKLVSNWLEDKLRQNSVHDENNENLLAIKFRTWDLEIHELRRVSFRADEEILLHNTFLNSGSSLLNELNHRNQVQNAQGLSRRNEFELLQANKDTCSKERKSVQWIDYHAIQTGEPVLRSPFSKRLLPERPPGPCYRSLDVTGGWIDTFTEDSDSMEAPSSSPLSTEWVGNEESPDEQQTLHAVPCPGMMDLQQATLCAMQELESPKKIIDSKSRHQNLSIYANFDTVRALRDQKLDWNSVRERLLTKGMAESGDRPRFKNSLASVPTDLSTETSLEDEKQRRVERTENKQRENRRRENKRRSGNNNQLSSSKQTFRKERATKHAKSRPALAPTVKKKVK